MRHRVEKSRLGRTTAHRNAMLRNMVTSLIEFERIQTTASKAKELRKVADRMITLAKKGGLHAYRESLRVIRRKDVAKKLFSELAVHYAGRDGGYTRILRLGRRPGDNADMVIIELVTKTVEKKEKKAAKAEKKSPLQAARDAVSRKPKKAAKTAKEGAKEKKAKEAAEPAKKPGKKKPAPKGHKKEE